MLHALLIFNNLGLPRLLKFYTGGVAEQRQQQIVRELYSLLSARPEHACSLVEASSWFGAGARVVYRQYATLYFVAAMDANESELAMLDLIQVLGPLGRSVGVISVRQPDSHGVLSV